MKTRSMFRETEAQSEIREITSHCEYIIQTRLVYLISGQAITCVDGGVPRAKVKFHERLSHHKQLLSPLKCHQHFTQIGTKHK